MTPFGQYWSSGITRLAVVAGLIILLVAAVAAQGQTFTVIHTFTGGADGSDPVAGVTVGGSGTLYGAGFGAITGISVVFELTHRGSGWILHPLYDMPGGYPIGPEGPLTVGPSGALYGTTNGGGAGRMGTVFELRPPAAACRTAICYWNGTVLHSFQGGANDGANPAGTKLVFDQAGNIYGTTEFGGSGNGQYCPSGCGTVFELSPSAGGWTVSVLHSFNNNGIDGYEPQYGVLFDPAGNLYGATPAGGNIEGPDGIGGGTAFELTPSGGGWTENIVYNFPTVHGDNGVQPGDIVMDQSGNLYGTTAFGGEYVSGSVFELTRSGGSWTFSALYSFDNCGPQPLARDGAGNLYGTCAAGGAYDAGWVFKLTNSGGSWTATDLHDFTGGSDGDFPSGPVVLDSNGNLYGTASSAGLQGGCGGEGCGTVWEITP
jgi:uncharacterized repeat protein (TIGR03803 family)